MKRNIALLSLFLGTLPAASAEALTVSADTKGYLGLSYGEKVLNSILQNWQRPQEEAAGRTAVIVRVAKDGRPFSCEIRQNSTSTAVDNSICQTVAEIGHFPPLETHDTGEIYLSFVHDDKAFAAMQKDGLPNSQAPEPIAGEEQVETVKNPIDSPIDEIQEKTQTDVEFAPLSEGNLAQHEKATENISREFSMPQEAVTVNSGTSLLATEPQPQTIIISREEALQPPSADLIDPSAGTQAYSQEILKQAAPKIRIPSSVSGTYQVVVRVDLTGNGILKNAAINKSSQNAAIDKEVLRVLQNEVQYPPLPDKSDQSLWLTFNIRK